MLGLEAMWYKISPDKKLCECGCGELIPTVNKRHELAKYKHNHHMRGKKRTDIAIKNISLAKTGSKNPMWKGGRYVTDGYIHVYKPDHPFATDGYMMEHRLAMEQYLGRYLLTEEVVHHINEDRQDNRIENLMILSRPEHQKLHRNKQLGRLV